MSMRKLVPSIFLGCSGVVLVLDAVKGLGIVGDVVEFVWGVMLVLAAITTLKRG